MMETIEVNVSFDTSFEDIELLKQEMEKFVRERRRTAATSSMISPSTSAASTTWTSADAQGGHQAQVELAQRPPSRHFAGPSSCCGLAPSAPAACPFTCPAAAARPSAVRTNPAYSSGGHRRLGTSTRKKTEDDKAKGRMVNQGPDRSSSTALNVEQRAAEELQHQEPLRRRRKSGVTTRPPAAVMPLPIRVSAVNSPKPRNRDISTREPTRAEEGRRHLASHAACRQLAWRPGDEDIDQHQEPIVRRGAPGWRKRQPVYYFPDRPGVPGTRTPGRPPARSEQLLSRPGCARSRRTSDRRRQSSAGLPVQAVGGLTPRVKSRAKAPAPRHVRRIVHTHCR